MNTWYMAEDGEAHVHAAFSAKLPQHLLGDEVEQYVDWQHTILVRLATLFPDDDDDMGTLVPLAMLHPHWDLDSNNLNSIAVQELSEINLQGNPLIELTT